jgi:hypothetical protein
MGAGGTVRPLLGLMVFMALAGCERSNMENAGVAPAEAANAQASALATLPECRKHFRIVTDKPLTLDMFTQLAAVDSVSTVPMSGGRVTLSYRSFDYEDTPIEGTERGVGVVYARGDQAGAPVVGGVIWASGVEIPSSGGYTLELPSGDGLYLKLMPLNAVDASEYPATCRGGYVVKLGRDRILYADGVKIGTVH